MGKKTEYKKSRETVPLSRVSLPGARHYPAGTDGPVRGHSGQTLSRAQADVQLAQHSTKIPLQYNTYDTVYY